MALGITTYLPSFGDNRLNYSRLIHYFEEVNCGDLYGIKYVQTGTENYYFNNERYSVNSNQYLIINKSRDYVGEVDATKPVVGFCINLEEKLLQKVYHEMSTSEKKLLDYPEYNNKVHLELFENVFSASDLLAQFMALHLIGRNIASADNSFDAYSFYNEMGSQLLLSQKFSRKQLQQIKASRPSTRKEIFSRINTAKNIIDSDLSQKLQIPDLAAQCYMSEFHFFRSFKQVYCVTPHQYILKKRLEKARRLLTSSRTSIAEIACQLAFSDVPSFSKAFKKHFSVPPSAIASDNKS